MGTAVGDMGGRMGRWFGGGEKLLAAVVIAAVALLILPVPAGLMDILLSTNIVFAVVLLLLSMQVGETLKVATFPTLLLVTTLFRLALNISTTRLILLEADAGEVVRAFGSFVVQGNPLVGGVLFSILTVVQFIVIAKGSERVAEVTARFTLDAMPGKQMSIDADLRAGVIDQAEAGRRRLELEREAQFHGAMDGAMKFVKGDAIAGMVIIVVNILGGLLVGTLQRGMPAAEALARYTVLTIGDGLVSQVPALLISTAAGLVITRVRPARPSNLGREVARQVGAHPEVFLFAGAVLAALGLVPGMPTLSFLVMGVLTLALGAFVQGRRRRAPECHGPEAAAIPSVVLQVEGKTPPPEFEIRLLAMLQALADDLGIVAPLASVLSGGPGGQWSLHIDEVPVAAGMLQPGEPLPWEGIGQALRRAAPRFVGVQETQDLLDRLERQAPALVREIVPRLVPPVLLAEILSRLVEEEVPIRNLKGILAALAEWARSEADPAQLAERVREDLRAVISHRLAPEGVLRALLLDPRVEQVLAKALQRTPTGTSLALSPEDGEGILRGLERALKSQQGAAVVVLTRPELRRPLWKLASAGRASVPVVSFLELEPALAVKPAGTVQLAA